jgi:hypothetical protein
MFSLNRENTKDVYVKENSVLSVEPLQSDLYVGGTFAYSINRNGAQILVDYIAKN